MTGSAEIEASDFFVAGGTLRPDSPSYVERPADMELFNLARTGEFCYVLTARQMGKSSLMIRTARRLRGHGVHSVIIDLTKIGTDVSVEQWYLGLLTQLKRNLKLSVDLESWWQERMALGYVQRFTDFLRDVLLHEIEGQVVIFMDEIDTTLNLPFSDDFFAAIRFVYNARATDPAFERLTFVLLGVATPADLIKDRSRTPFNIGQGIDLGDFSRTDAQVLQHGLKAAYPNEAETVFDRIFFWTHGHPYLTQKLCLSAVETEDGLWSNDRVDELVEKLFLSKEARKETNLQFVRDNIGQATTQDRRRLLTLYRQVYNGKTVPEDDRSLDQNQLKLVGLVRVEDNTLKVRNEIYRRVFNQEWIKANRPVDRPRLAILTILVLIISLAVAIGFLIYQQRQRAITEQAQIYTDTFRSSTDSNERIKSLAGLFDLSEEYAQQAEQLFYKDLSSEERSALFKSVNPLTVGSQLVTVVRRLYADLDNNERDNTLLAAMAEPLKQVEDVRAASLATEIEQWLLGREFFNQKDYEQAATVYGVVIKLNDRNAGVYYDRGLAYQELGQVEPALVDFETTLTLSRSRQERIAKLVGNNPRLYDVAMHQGSLWPELVALLPTPTSTPTPTPTPTFTPTSTPTPTATPTPTPTPLASSTSTPAVIQPAAPLQTATDTPAPTPTPLPTITPTSTPKPATVVYVQSNGQSHSLGLVSSTGQVINGDLHRFAGAPAWSPDGAQIAFYGEPSINSLGGIYSRGSGIWLMGVSSGSVALLFQIDHVNNSNWSPDGTKLALEVGPPGVTHQIFVIDARDGKELNRFAGEQPAWSPNSQEVVIKSCLPECGLWRVGFDGSGGQRLTNDSTDSYPSWSANGGYIVFASRSRHGDWEIYRLHPVSDDIVRLTNRLGTDTTPVFSPDSLEIYFRTDVFGGWQISALAVDGSHERPVLTGIGSSDDWGLARPAVH